jgi:hypothetical protein
MAAAVVFLAAVLAHAVTGRRYGIPLGQVTLWMLGFATELRRGPDSPRMPHRGKPPGAEPRARRDLRRARRPAIRTTTRAAQRIRPVKMLQRRAVTSRYIRQLGDRS